MEIGLDEDCDTLQEISGGRWKRFDDSAAGLNMLEEVVDCTWAEVIDFADGCGIGFDEGIDSNSVSLDDPTADFWKRLDDDTDGVFAKVGDRCAGASVAAGCFTYADICGQAARPLGGKNTSADGGGNIDWGRWL